MRFVVDSASPQRVVVRLRDGEAEAEVSGRGAAQAAAALVDAIDGARRDGSGECYWQEPTGQYWWLCRQEDRRLEVVVLWSSGAVTGWQHVFRATDEADYVAANVRDQLSASGLLPPVSS